LPEFGAPTIITPKRKLQLSQNWISFSFQMGVSNLLSFSTQYFTALSSQAKSSGLREASG